MPMNLPLHAMPSRPLHPVPFAPPPDANAPSWQAAVLDELDHGIVLLCARQRILYCNPAARRELDEAHPLERIADTLRGRRPHDDMRWQLALHDAARRGLRRMLSFDGMEGPVAVAVVPMPASADAQAPAVLAMLGRSRVCETLSAQGFGACVGLTPAEREVLALLAARRRPADIARAQGVALSTVRSHIASIRLKTGAASIRDLVTLLARLPPLTGTLRH